MIKHFKTRKHAWLSNFMRVVVIYEKREYPSVEHAYMAAKSDDLEWRNFCANDKNTAGAVKRASRKIALRPDWEEDKCRVMRLLLDQKFRTEPFRTKLLATGEQHIQEGNWWNDRFWGVDLRTGLGQNILGQMIMEIRAELRAASST